MKVLIAACCAGSAEALSPVIKILRYEGSEVEVIGVEKARAGKGSFGGSAGVFRKQKIDFSELESAGFQEPFYDIPDETVRRYLRQHSPDCIVTGTSRDPEGLHRGIEEALIVNGVASEIPVVQVVDSWEVWYPRGFSGYQADAYLVPDEITGSVIRKRGAMREETIHITGNPAWESFCIRQKIDKEKVRKQLGVFPGQRLYLYYTGVTPDDLTTLTWVLRSLRRRERLILRRHPRDRRGYTQILSPFEKYIIDSELHSDELLIYGDICLTHHGAMGLKAALSGITTVNFILPGDCDQLCRVCSGYPLSLLGGSYQIGCESEYKRLIGSVTPPKSDILKKKLCIDGNAGRRIVDFLMDLQYSFA